jgi:hypothetical protein
MAKIYVSHARGWDFKNELYSPLRESFLNEKHEIILPHEHGDGLFSSKEFFQNSCDLLLVEGSRPKLGVGIEVGWADAFDVPIFTLYQEGAKQSTSLNSMSSVIVGYESSDDLISKLEPLLEAYVLMRK